MKAISKILKTTTSKKMIASLIFLHDLNKSNFNEFKYINELPLKQQELFDTIYKLLNYSKIELALLLINNKILKNGSIK